MSQLKNIISAKEFDKKYLEKIFSVAEYFKSRKDDESLLKGKIMSTLFYEPSTRTRLSFESAMLRLGGSVISTENAAEFSSASKGETLEDTIRVVNCFSDVIVLRHFTEGASKVAAKYSKVPIINAGDGKGEHPTQALLDLFTIRSNFKSPNLTVAMVGDLANGRTIHSLSYLLSLYKEIKIIFISPKALSIPNSLRMDLKKANIRFKETEDLTKALKVADVIYQTRIQKERFVSSEKGPFSESDYLSYFGKYIIDKKSLAEIKKTSIIMHPLPRVNEISPDVDSDPRALYFQQVQNGIYVRMAVLSVLFDKQPSIKQ